MHLWMPIFLAMRFVRDVCNVSQDKKKKKWVKKQQGAIGRQGAE